MVRHVPLTLIPIHFPVVRVGQELSSVVAASLANEGVTLERGDVVAVASKVVSTCEGRIVTLRSVLVSPRAKRLARKWKIDTYLTSIVLREADEIFGGVPGFLLTVKNGILTPNAGVDLKNSPPGMATLWPGDPDRSARNLRANLERRYTTRVGVEIVDSHVTPLRLGTVGLAIGVSGFLPVLDSRKRSDLFGRTIKVTQTNVADDLAAAAQLLMGEAAERIGAVLIRGAPVTLNNSGYSKLAKMNRDKCLIASSLGTGYY
ncbi:MAG: coenzyme F420-0:L-glutamate ligase [Candidatus Bathyarchaeia archaeon]